MSKTERTAESRRAANLAVARAGLALVEKSLETATGSERERLEGERAGLLDCIRQLGG